MTLEERKARLDAMEKNLALLEKEVNELVVSMNELAEEYKKTTEAIHALHKKLG